MNCPLCLSEKSSPYSKDKQREYFECTDCSLVYVTRESIISTSAERARYDTHNNDEKDERYHAYLGEIVSQMKPYIGDGESALDFGSGRTDLLAGIMQKAGLVSEPYDYFYFQREEIWQKKFDVIVMSEVIEHLRDLRPVMERLLMLLKPGGRFFIKTKMLPETKEAFDRWYYKNDPTHVEFFNERSFEVLAEILKLEPPVFLEHDLVMLRSTR